MQNLNIWVIIISSNGVTVYSDFIQLEFYATRERHVGDSQIISAEANYAIDGQYVSNWPWIDLPNECKNSSWDSNTSTKFLFLNPNVTIEGDRLKSIQNLTLIFVDVIAVVLVYLLHKLLLQNEIISNISDKNSQPFVLFIGFLLCTFTLGIWLIVAELLSWNMHSRPTDLNNHLKIILPLIVIFVMIDLFILIVVDNKINPFKHTEMKLLYTFLLTIIVFSVPIFLFYFELLWIIASSFDTLLFALAYPVYFITLGVLHIAFVFVEFIFFSFIVSEVLWLTKKFKNIICFRISFFCLMLIYYLYLNLFLGCLYITIIWGYAYTIVQRIVPTEGVAQGLLFVPSLILFAVGWLLKQRFFVTGIKCMKS